MRLGRLGLPLMSQKDERLIIAAVERYVLAVSAIDEQGLRAAFHPSASVIGYFQTAIEWISVDSYVGEVLGAGLSPNHSPRWKIDSVDVTNDAAIAKVEDEFGSLKFTNYLSLLRIAGEWKIVSKLYHLHP